MADLRGGHKARPRARLLPRSFYSAPPDAVAKRLLGKLLVRPADSRTPELMGRIAEVEAYFGAEDPAAHAFVGKTARNAVLFGPPGHAYVYFIYGMHSCLNVSCGPKGQAGCVLIRALEPISGLEVMAERRWPAGKPAEAKLTGLPRSTSGLIAIPPKLVSALTSGPGRLCQAFAITRAADNGADFASSRSRLQIKDDGSSAGKITVTPRIGIRKAADRMARFVIVK